MRFDFRLNVICSKALEKDFVGLFGYYLLYDHYFSEYVIDDKIFWCFSF